MFFKKTDSWPIRIKLYSKPDCHLCEEIKRTLHSVSAQFEFNVEEVNILESESLYEKFKWEIPVIYINGRKAFKYQMSKEALIKRLKREA